VLWEGKVEVCWKLGGNVALRLLDLGRFSSEVDDDAAGE